MINHSTKHLVVLIALAFVTWPGLTAAQSFRLGRAAVDITPPLGMPFQVPQRPPFPVMVATGVHDSQHAKAVVFESDGIKAAVVACDLTSIPVHLIAKARERVALTSSVPPTHVTICATHTLLFHREAVMALAWGCCVAATLGTFAPRHANPTGFRLESGSPEPRWGSQILGRVPREAVARHP